MTVQEFKKAVNEDKTVCWVPPAYRVIKDSIGQYLIICLLNNNCIGLTWRDGVTLNGEEQEFFTI